MSGETPVVELESQISASYRLALNGTTFIIHNDALDAFQSSREESLLHFLRRAYAEGRLDRAKRWLGFGYECVSDPNGRDFYILGPQLNGKMARLPAHSPRPNAEELEMECSNLYEAPSLGKSRETGLPAPRDPTTRF